MGCVWAGSEWWSVPAKGPRPGGGAGAIDRVGVLEACSLAQMPCHHTACPAPGCVHSA